MKFMSYAYLFLVLQNRWRLLERDLKKDQKQQTLYDSLKDDIHNLDTDISQLQSKLQSNENKKSVNVKNMLRFYKVIFYMFTQ